MVPAAAGRRALLITTLFILALVDRKATEYVDQHTQEVSSIADRLYRDQIESSADMLGATLEVSLPTAHCGRRWRGATARPCCCGPGCQ